MQEARAQLALLRFARLIVSQLGSISSLRLIPTIHSFSSLRVQCNAHGALTNPDLSQATAPSKQKRTHAVFRVSSAHRLASTSKPRFDGEWVPLTNLCRPKQWKTIPKTALLNHGYPVYGANGVIGYYDSYNHESETILIGCRGTCGQVNVCRPQSYVTGNAMCLDNLDDVVNIKYLELFLKSFDFRKIIGGTSQPQITKQGLSRVLVPIKSLGEQLAIAERLECLRKLNTINVAKMSAFDILVKSRFVEMFGDPCEPEKSGIPSAAIKDVCELRIGPFGSSLHKEDYVANCHPLVNPSHIVEGRIRTDDELTVGEEKYSSMAPYHLHKGDVVLGRRGEIGRCAVVDSEGMLCGTGSMILRPMTSKCRSDYLQQVVSFPSFASALEIQAVGVTMKNLNAKIVGNAVIALPPLALQQKFADFVAQVDKSRFSSCICGASVLRSAGRPWRSTGWCLSCCGRAGPAPALWACPCLWPWWPWCGGTCVGVS